MEKILLYATVDAPPPPQEMFNYFDEKVREHGEERVWEMLEKNQFRLPGDTRGSEITERKLKHPSGEFMHAFNNTMFFDKDMVKWVHENISPLAKDIRFNHTTPNRDRLGPHVDATRNCALIWIIRSGGPDHRTVFYKQKSTGMVVGPANYVVDDYSDLEEIGSIGMPYGTWVFLNGTTIHSVENISEGRFAIQISFDETPDVKIKEACYYQG